MVKKTFEWIGHVLAGLIVLYIIFYGSKTDLTGVSLLLGLCYLARTCLATSRVSIYTAIFLLSLSYLLLAERLLGMSFLPLCWLVFFLILQGFGPDPIQASRLFTRASALEKDEGEKDHHQTVELAAPLAISTRIISALLVGYLIWNQVSIANAYVLIVPLVLLALYDLRLTLHYENSWYLFSLGTTFAGAYYFFLHQIVGSAVNVVMALWVVLAVLYLIGAFWLSRRDKDYAHGFFAAAFMIAAIAMTVVVLSAFLANRIEPVQPVIDTAILQGQPVPFDRLAETQRPPATGLAAPTPNFTANLSSVLVFLAVALVFTCMRIKYERNEFVYMLVLLLGLVGYFFIVVAEDPLYRSLINYLVYGLLVVGVCFVYRVTKEFFDVSWSLADFLSVHYTRILYAFIPVGFILMYFLFDYSMAVTENSHFCGSCHLMRVQFESWKKDRHSEKGVTCFDCHYSPGFANFLKGRTSGLVMVVKNFTGLSRSKFPATVSDKSCTKCHLDGTLMDRPKLESWITYKKNIKFNHKVMVHQTVYGVQLTCTSCHNHYRYNPEMSHLFTPEEVCYACHLMKRKQEIGTAIGNCYTCHYQETIEKDLNNLVTIGNGEVTREKCLGCHWESKKFGDAEYQHKLHGSEYQDFTKSGIGCLDCHERIQHGDLTKLINP